MTTSAIALAALLLGLVLIVLGWRGRRVGDHPACRKCGFDLSGLAVGNGPCPECGRTLDTPRATARGTRRRRPALAALGAVLLVPAVLVLVLTQAQGPGLHRFKPLALILFEARHAGPNLAGELGAELLQRYADGKIAGSELDRVVRSLLDVQAVPTTSWDDAYGDLLETVGISPDQYERYSRQMVRLTIRARERVARSAPIPVGIVITEIRSGSNTNIELRLVLREPTINGQPASLRRHPHSGPPGSPYDITNIRILPNISNKTNVVLVDPSHALEPGEISMTLDVQVAPISPSRETMLTEEDWHTHRGITPLIAGDPATVSADPALPVQATPSRSSPRMTFTGHAGHQLPPYLSISRVQTDQPLAHRAFLVYADGTELPVGWYTNSPAPALVQPREPITDPPPLDWNPEPWQRVFDLSNSSISAVANPLDRPIPVPSDARLILRPDPWFAERTLDILTLPTGEIDLGEVSVQVR